MTPREIETGAGREVALIVNVRSRSGARAARLALPELERLGVRVQQHAEPGSGLELMAAVRRAIAAGIQTIVIGGGDGTLSGVVDLFANQPQLTLGLLPVGTGNEVARMLGIPLDLPSACRVIAEGGAIAVDLAEANGNYFVHTALVGYAAHANRHVPAWLKSILGKAAYIYVLASSLLHRQAFQAWIEMADDRWEGETPLILVGNSQFHQPARALLPPLNWRDAGLIVYGPRDDHWTTLLRLAIGLWITRRPQPSLLFCLSAREAIVDANPPQPSDLDGEYGRHTPITFRLAPQALRVLVPMEQG